MMKVTGRDDRSIPMRIGKDFTVVHGPGVKSSKLDGMGKRAGV